MKSLWNVWYDNGEHIGLIQITAKDVHQIDTSIVAADEVQIDVDHVIADIEKEADDV